MFSKESAVSFIKSKHGMKFPDHPVEKHFFPRIIDSFQKAMKLKVHLVPVHGKNTMVSVNGNRHPFCVKIWNCPNGRQRCLKEISRATRISLETGEPYIFQCHADMIEFTAAISYGGASSYALICGPLLLRHPDSLFRKDVLAKVRDLSINSSSLQQTFSQIPVFSERRVQAAADLLYTMANYLSRTDSIIQSQQQEITRQQSLLAEALYQRKKSETERCGDQVLGSHPMEKFEKEKELIDLIKFGERKKAKALLDELLGTALFRSHEHIGILKARVLEIIFIIARAAVEAGANLEEILGFNYQCIQNLSKDDSQEALYYFLIKAFEQLFEIIYQNRNIQHTRVFTRAKEYIWGNYNKGITLKRLAEAVGISPYYLSHLFRKEMNISFLEYLTSVRLSIAKNLLINTTMTVMDICLEVGYQDPSHFAKMFKKKEGVHPTECRKRG
jgi:two-component system response regulator YesN